MTDFTFYNLDNAQGQRKETLGDIQKKYGFIPNLFAYMAESPYTIDAYNYLNAQVEKTGFTPAQQQIALLAVSHYHDCGFCRVAHHAFGKMSKANMQTIDAILNNNAIEDGKDAAIVEMLLNILDNRGWVNDEHLQKFFDAGFEKRHVYDLILITTIKTLSNYSNHLSKPEANDELKSMI